MLRYAASPSSKPSPPFHPSSIIPSTMAPAKLTCLQTKLFPQPHLSSTATSLPSNKVAYPFSFPISISRVGWLMTNRHPRCPPLESLPAGPPTLKTSTKPPPTSLRPPTVSTANSPSSHSSWSSGLTRLTWSSVLRAKAHITSGMKSVTRCRSS